MAKRAKAKRSSHPLGPEKTPQQSELLHTGEEGQLVYGLLALAQSLSSERPLGARLTDLCRTTVELIGCDRSSIFLREGEYYWAKYNFGNPPDIALLFPKHKVSLQDPLVARAMKTRDFVMVNDAPHSSLMDADTAKVARIQSIVVSPLLDDSQQPLGFITAEYNENPGSFTDMMSTLVLGFAKLAEMTVMADRHDAERVRAEEAVRTSETLLEKTFASLDEAVLVVDPNTRMITACNLALERIFGYSEKEVVGRNTEFLHVDRAAYEQFGRDLFPALDADGVYVTDFQMRRNDGTVFFTEHTVTEIVDDSGRRSGVVSVIRDITERKQAEEALRRANRAYHTLSNCNQALVRATEEPELLQSVCRNIVETGGYRLAWVGFAEQDEEKSVRPVAQMGYEEGYLETTSITWADSERGKGPTGTAIRTRAPSVARKILTNPDYEPWRAEAVKRGYGSSAALPLVAGEQIIGALNVYAAEQDAFDEEEVGLLSELADDLAYGIMALRTRAERKRVEEALRESEERFERLSEATFEGILIHDEGRILDANEQYAEMFGYDVAEVTGMHVLDFTAPESRDLVSRNIKSRYEHSYEHLALRRDGSVFPVEVRRKSVPHRGRTADVVAVLDITERRRAEEALRESEHKVRQVIDGLGPHMLVGLMTPTGALIEANRPALEIAGLKPEDVLGKPFWEAFWWSYSESIQKQLREAIQRAAAGDTSRYDVLVRAAHGQFITIDFCVQPLFDDQGKVKYLVPSAVDITERKMAEEELESLTEERERLVRRVLVAQEEERTNVAHDIHDGPTQQAVAAQMFLEAFRHSRRHMESPDAEMALDKCLMYLESAIEEARRIIANLRPAALDDLGLAGALRQHAEETATARGLHITFRSNVRDRLPDVVESELFRIAQEGLNNAVKHSGSQRMSVTLQTTKVGISLTIRDWGSGFDPKSVAGRTASERVGLISMRERAVLLGGSLEVTSTVGEGTTVRARIPVPTSDSGSPTARAAEGEDHE